MSRVGGGSARDRLRFYCVLGVAHSPASQIVAILHGIEAILRDQPGTGDWNNLFLFCAAMFVVSGAAGLGIDATKPIVLDKRTDLS